MSDNPVLVEVTRGGHVESRHRGAAVVSDAAGKVVAAWGDVSRPVFPRSAIKPVQAISVLESGAAAAARMSDKEIAIACASHGGEPFHTETVAAWLDRIGLSANDLECGAHPPTYAPASEALIRAGETPTPLHNNCSGKHSGMLSLALHEGHVTGGYTAPDHPTQSAWRRVLGEMAGVDLRDAPAGTDGCNIPTIALPLDAMARAAARFAAPDGLDDDRAAACRRIRAALTAAPEMIAGTGRFCTGVIRDTGGRALVKTGAEGVYFGALPEAGLGIALKIDDGADRASEVAMAAILHTYGEFDGAVADSVAARLRVPVPNRRGFTVGEVGPARDWLKV